MTKPWSTGSGSARKVFNLKSAQTDEANRARNLGNRCNQTKPKKESTATSSQNGRSDNSESDQNHTSASSSNENGSLSMESSDDEDRPSTPTPTMSKKAKAANRQNLISAPQKQKSKHTSKDATDKRNPPTKKRPENAATPMSKSQTKTKLNYVHD